MSVISSDGAYRKINGKWLIAPEHVSIHVDLVPVKLFTNEAIAVRIVPQSRARKNNKCLAQAPSTKQPNSFKVQLSTLSAQRAGLKNEMVASGDSRWYSERAAEGKRKSTCRSRMFLFMNLVRYSKVSISDQQAAVHELSGGSRGISKVCSKLKHGMLQKWARTDSI
jgi:hypothetical protein